MSELELPPLRENLSVSPEDKRKKFSKSWVIYDPLAHRFHQIGHLEYLVLSLWHLGNKNKIINELQVRHKKHIDDAHFDEFFQFLVVNRLLHKSAFTEAFATPSKPILNKIKQLQKLFFIKIRLLRPDALLHQILPYFTWLFSRYFHAFMMVVIAFGVAGVIQNFSTYKSTFIDFFEFSDLGLWFIALAIIKVVHEFAHAITAKYYRCNVAGMGVAFMIFWPILYTDTTDAWSLQNRKQRIFISSAGVISEIYLAAICSILWLLLPDSTLKSVAFLLSGTAWITSLLINANPFMRFDGYFVLSDALKVPNLHHSATYCTQQYLDKSLYGITPKPDLGYVSTKLKPKLAFFGVLMWIYRIFLITVILVLLYNLVFKLLALMLMAVYITSSIIVPLSMKIMQLAGDKTVQKNRKVQLRSVLVLSAIVAFLFVPWRSSIDVASIVHFEDSSVMFAQDDAIVETVLVEHGQHVFEGQILAVLTSPSLEYKLKQVVLDKDELQWKYRVTSVNREYKALLQTTLKELEEKKGEYDRYSKQIKQLELRAPHDGKVYFSEVTLLPGTSFEKDQEILSVVDIEKAKLTGYIEENIVKYIGDDNHAVFYPEDPSFDKQEVVIDSFSPVGRNSLSYPYLASIYGGKIAARKDSETGELVPEKGVYSLRGQVKGYTHEKSKLNLITRGTVVVNSKPYSIAGSAVDFIYASFLKHSSF